jgi:argininosuccinate lyase
MKLWGGRFEQGPAEAFERFSGSLHIDKQFLEVDIQGSQAFARALHRVGILTEDERDRLVAAFDEILVESRQSGFLEGATDEDVHTVVIRKLKEKVASLADKIHTGRSRNEQVSLDARLWLRAEIDRCSAELLALLEALLNLARKYPEAVIPGYTHLRRAQAVLWPHYLMAYFEMFSRDFERLQQARARANLLPLGSGALAGSGFPFDRHAIAQDLGFEGVTNNSMDVSADRDFALDFAYAASTAMLHLSRLAEDWIIYSSEEFGWLELGDGVTSGSSLMPQKKNPDSLELIRGKCGRVHGDLNALLMIVKGLPLTYNRDMQECWEPLFDAAHHLRGSLEMARVVAETTQLRPEIPARAAAESWVVATDLAEALARSGVPFHKAHQLAGRLVLESLKQNKFPSSWTADELVAFDPAFQPEMVSLMDPSQGMKTRELPGGTGPKVVAAALDEAASRLDTMRRSIV